MGDPPGRRSGAVSAVDRVVIETTGLEVLRDDPASRRDDLASPVARINTSARTVDIQNPLAQPETLRDH